MLVRSGQAVGVAYQATNVGERARRSGTPQAGGVIPSGGINIIDPTRGVRHIRMPAALIELGGEVMYRSRRMSKWFLYPAVAGVPILIACCSDSPFEPQFEPSGYYQLARLDSIPRWDVWAMPAHLDPGPRWCSPEASERTLFLATLTLDSATSEFDLILTTFEKCTDQPPGSTLGSRIENRVEIQGEYHSDPGGLVILDFGTSPDFAVGAFEWVPPSRPLFRAWVLLHLTIGDQVWTFAKSADEPPGF